MSWDVVIVKIRGDFRPISEVGAENFLKLGGLEAVQSAIRSAFPTAEWSSPVWAVYSGPDFGIDTDLQSNCD